MTRRSSSQRHKARPRIPDARSTASARRGRGLWHRCQDRVGAGSSGGTGFHTFVRTRVVCSSTHISWSRTAVGGRRSRRNSNSSRSNGCGGSLLPALPTLQLRCPSWPGRGCQGSSSERSPGRFMAGRSSSVRRRSKCVAVSMRSAIASDRLALGRPEAAGTSCPAESAWSSTRSRRAREAKWISRATGWRSTHRPEPSRQLD